MFTPSNRTAWSASGEPIAVDAPAHVFPNISPL
jgi:hypothetical protein